MTRSRNQSQVLVKENPIISQTTQEDDLQIVADLIKQNVPAMARAQTPSLIDLNKPELTLNDTNQNEEMPTGICSPESNEKV